jgi:hypothetical protein
MEILGIDVGSTKMAMGLAAVAAPYESRVLTTPGGMKTVPPLVSVRGKARYCGEAAAMQSRSNASNTVTDLALYLGKTPDQVRFVCVFCVCVCVCVTKSVVSCCSGSFCAPCAFGPRFFAPFPVPFSLLSFPSFLFCSVLFFFSSFSVRLCVCVCVCH